jgi:hypothetical protein
MFSWTRILAFYRKRSYATASCNKPLIWRLQTHWSFTDNQWLEHGSRLNWRNVYTLCIFVLWLDSPVWAWASSFRRGFTITQISDTPQSVGLLWTRDQPVAETSTWQQHTTLTRDRHPCPRWIRTHDPSKRAAEDPRLRPYGHWDRHTLSII